MIVTCFARFFSIVCVLFTVNISWSTQNTVTVWQGISLITRSTSSSLGIGGLTKNINSFTFTNLYEKSTVTFNTTIRVAVFTINIWIAWGCQSTFSTIQLVTRETRSTSSIDLIVILTQNINWHTFGLQLIVEIPDWTFVTNSWSTVFLTVWILEWNSTVSSYQSVSGVTWSTLAICNVWSLTQWVQSSTFGSIQPVSTVTFNTSICIFVSSLTVWIFLSRRDTHSIWYWKTFVTRKASSVDLVVIITVSVDWNTFTLWTKVVPVWTWWAFVIDEFFAIGVSVWVVYDNCDSTSTSVIILRFFTKSTWSNCESSDTSLTNVVTQSHTIGIKESTQVWWSNNSEIGFALITLFIDLIQTVQIETVTVDKSVTINTTQTSSSWWIVSIA